MDHPPPLIRPTPGPVRAAFRYDPTTPFAPGQRRGTTFVARPGNPVAAPCRGRVTFAGRTPQGRAVTVRCGGWTATVLGVAAAVRPGTSLAAGGVVGRAATTTVGLSLRPVGDRWGYVDPRPSFRDPRTGTPLGPSPRARRTPRPAPLRRPIPGPGRVPRPSARPVAVPSTVARPSSSPEPSWPVAVPVETDPAGPVRADPRLVAVGLALAALGLPALRRRRRSAHPRPGAGGARYLPSVDR